ncbi:MAG: hypothetical protein O2841_03325 [Actinomycetota bacterium]|nr:hypothetical protein [Actinomycetota bacterium]
MIKRSFVFIVWCLVVVAGVVRRALGIGRLTSKGSATSYWVDKSPLPKDHFERQR